jgi:predicted ester cyclase
MNAVDRFASYAMAFEQAFVSDDWTAVAEQLTDDVTYETFGNGIFAGRAEGRAAVLARLRRLVNCLDRRFDERVPEILAGPSEREGGVWMRFALNLQRAGLPDLGITGDHTTYFHADRVCRIEEYIPVSVSNAVDAYLAAHDAKLKPAAVQAPVSATTMRRLVGAYAAAKSRQDIDAALALCSDDFELETVALGIRAVGREAARLQLGLFFLAFPDYRVSLDGLSTGDEALAAWGRARLTFAGPLAELRPTGRTAELPIFCVFTFASDRIRSERFFFDLATLGEQLRMPIEPLRASAAALRE